MSLIPKDEITQLKRASEVKSVAESAKDDFQLAAVAAAINNAANTGETSTIFEQKLTESVRSTLESRGYEIQYFGVADPTRMVKIDWSK